MANLGGNQGQNPAQHGPQPPPPPPPPPALGAQERFFQSLVDQLANNRNQARQASAKSIPCEIYKSGDDFDMWCNLFVDSVRAVNDLGPGDARLEGLCLRWLPTKLQTGPVRTVYENLSPNVKNDWRQLKSALSESFKDNSEEIKFLSNEAAWLKTPEMSLREYKDGLVLRLEKYQPDLKAVGTEYQRQAVRRFRLGLQNPVLESHILLTCVGNRHTLQDAYQASVNWENTLSSLSTSGSRMAAPSLAGFLNYPQLSALSTETPVIGAFSTVQEKRFDSIESSVKKHELDLSELKTSIVELKDSVNEVKTELVTPRFARPIYQRPQYPPARLPNATAYGRPYYSQFNRVPRHQGIVPGLTGGRGYVTRHPAPVPRSQAVYNSGPASSGPIERGQQAVGDMAGKKETAVDSKVIGALDQGEQIELSQSFPNPHLQYGLMDNGFGWVDYGLNEGMQEQPDGLYAIDESHFIQ